MREYILILKSGFKLRAQMDKEEYETLRHCLVMPQPSAPVVMFPDVAMTRVEGCVRTSEIAAVLPNSALDNDQAFVGRVRF